MKKSHSDRIFIKITYIKGTAPAHEILPKIKEKFERWHRIDSEWDSESHPNAFFIYFPSRESFYSAYKRDIPTYENLLKILMEHPEFSSEPLFPAPPIVNPIQAPELYCILKYETSDKIPLRNYYQFIFRVGQMLGVNHSFEEIDNGFLLLYRRKLDFDLSLLDLLKIETVIDILKQNRLWTAKNEKMITNLLQIMQNK
jgi:hypothetical protein